MKQISFDNGKTWFYESELTTVQIDSNWDLIVQFMDDDTREEVHALIAPCSTRDFLRKYLELAKDNLVIG